MVSPTNSDVGLTRATPITPERMLTTLYPSGGRNYARVHPREDALAAAAVLARDLGARRAAVLSDGGYGETQAFHFARAARGLGMEVVLARRWRPQAGALQRPQERLAIGARRNVLGGHRASGDC